MKTRSTLLSLAALATLSLSALAPTQASAWGMRDGYGFGGGYHSRGHFGPSFRQRAWASESCSAEQAPTFRRSFTPGPRFTEEFSSEGESFEPQGYGPAQQPREFGPMRQAQGYASGQEMQGNGPSRPEFPVPESHGRRGFGQPHRGQDAYEETPEVEMQTPPQETNRDAGPSEYSSKELQR